MKLHYHKADAEANILRVVEQPLGSAVIPNAIMHLRPQYVTISAKEFTDTTMTEKQVLLYISKLKKSLNFGGAIYLEIENYG